MKKEFKKHTKEFLWECRHNCLVLSACFMIGYGLPITLWFILRLVFGDEYFVNDFSKSSIKILLAMRIVIWIVLTEWAMNNRKLWRTYDDKK